MAENFGTDPKFSARNRRSKGFMKSARYTLRMLVVLGSRIMGSYRFNGNYQV